MIELLSRFDFVILRDGSAPAQERPRRNHQVREVNAIADRSIAYSADTVGRAGRIACTALRTHVVDDDRVAFAIVVRNDTSAEAHVNASVPDSQGPGQRTIVQSVVGPYADFSTNVEFDVTRLGGIPELRVTLAGDDIAFELVVPGARTHVGVLAGDRGAPARASAGGSALVAPATATASSSASASATASRAYAYAPRNQAGPASRDVIVPYRAARSPAIVPMLAAFIAIVAGVAIGIARPAVTRLDVPSQTSAGIATAATYRATGIGAVTYRVTGPAGEVRESGTVTAGTGTFTFTLPSARDERAYLVRVTMAGPLGLAFAERYVHVDGAPVHATVAPPAPRSAPPPPQIRSLALDRASLAGGETLNVYYDVAATSGTVALVDGASLISYGKSALSPAGHTALVVPVVTAPRFLSVVLTAARGGATVESRVGVTATPQTSPSPQPDTGGTTTDGAPNASVVAPPTVDAPATVRSGGPIAVDISGGVPGLILVLHDDAGSELARRDVGTRPGRSIFRAPAVSTTTHVRLEATYPQGTGVETIVRTIVVVPR